MFHGIYCAINIVQLESVWIGDSAATVAKSRPGTNPHNQQPVTRETGVAEGRRAFERRAQFVYRFECRQQSAASAISKRHQWQFDCHFWNGCPILLVSIVLVHKSCETLN